MGEDLIAQATEPPTATLSHPFHLTFSIANLRVLDGHPPPKPHPTPSYQPGPFVIAVHQVDPQPSL